MANLSSALRKSLERRVAAYHEQLLSPQGSNQLAYLTEERGLTVETVKRFRLGVVGEPQESDEPARGSISIPYLTPSGPVSLRFRKATSEPAAMKYWAPEGTETTIFNTAAIVQHGSWIVITEGEIDCMTAVQCGLPAVGFPGANSWKAHFRPIFDGYQRVVICADNDDKGSGQDFAEKLAREVPGPAIFKWPQGHDLNSFYCEFGVDAVRDYLKIKN